MCSAKLYPIKACQFGNRTRSINVKMTFSWMNRHFWQGEGFEKKYVQICPKVLGEYPLQYSTYSTTWRVTSSHRVEWSTIRLGAYRYPLIFMMTWLVEEIGDASLGWYEVWDTRPTHQSWQKNERPLSFRISFHASIHSCDRSPEVCENPFKV